MIRKFIVEQRMGNSDKTWEYRYQSELMSECTEFINDYPSTNYPYRIKRVVSIIIFEEHKHGTKSKKASKRQK